MLLDLVPRRNVLKLDSLLDHSASRIFVGHLPVDVKDNIYAMAFFPFMKDMGHG